jgi:hypothetical protein
MVRNKSCGWHSLRTAFESLVIVLLLAGSTGSVALIADNSGAQIPDISKYRITKLNFANQNFMNIQPSSCVAQPSGLVAWWPMDEILVSATLDINCANNSITALGPTGVGTTSAGGKVGGVKVFHREG